ncbi:MAG: hypothetical protein ACHQYP_06540 [Nitrospiria bacterium]
MTYKSFFHSDCGGKLSLWAGLIYCNNCGHIPIDLPPEIDFTDITVFLPHLIEGGIIAKSDFHGIIRKQI